jgi:dihydroorotate dehydrogenase
MNPYSLIRPLLFSVDPETAHDITLKTLSAAQGAVNALHPKMADKPVHIMGLTFKNPVGLAAGLDKNGDCLDVSPII